MVDGVELRMTRKRPDMSGSEPADGVDDGDGDTGNDGAKAADTSSGDGESSEDLDVLLIENLDVSVTEAAIWKMFLRAGSMKSFISARRHVSTEGITRVAVVEFHDRESLERSVLMFDGYVYKSCVLRLRIVRTGFHVVDGVTKRWVKPVVRNNYEDFKRVLTISNINSKVTEEQLVDAVEEFGKVVDLILQKDYRSLAGNNIARVLFEESASVEKAFHGKLYDMGWVPDRVTKGCKHKFQPLAGKGCKKKLFSSSVECGQITDFLKSLIEDSFSKSERRLYNRRGSIVRPLPLTDKVDTPDECGKAYHALADACAVSSLSPPKNYLNREVIGEEVWTEGDRVLDFMRVEQELVDMMDGDVEETGLE